MRVYLLLFCWLLLPFCVRAVQPFTFEKNSQNELWTLVNSEEIDKSLLASKHSHMFATPYDIPTKSTPESRENNFRIVVGSVLNATNHYAYFSSREPKSIVPMVVSTYFQHTSSSCELSFRYRLHGITGSELIVSTQHLEHQALLVNNHEEEAEEAAEDWIRPTLRASFKPVRDDNEQWITTRVPIGQTVYPSRIRIECHTAQQQRDTSLLNVECNVDDIQLVNCDEEIWKADICSSKQSKKYLCRLKGPQKCIDYDNVCDMHPECEAGEDEDNAIHKCNVVPLGARCDYELNTETGCPHWKFFSPTTPSSSSNNGSQYLQKISLANTKRMPTHGLPPRGQLAIFCSFPLTVSRAIINQMEKFSTRMQCRPPFPPTSPETSLPESPNYRTCMVRFFYCHTSTSTFQLVLENGADFSHKEVLWTPPKTTGSEPCSWQKASALIPHQETEYRLKIAFGKLYKQPVSVAVDDFSITPNCFINLNSWTSRFISDKMQVEACDSKDCKESTTDSNGLTVINDKRSWIVPANGLYHVQLYGAAGGFLPGQEAKNLGGIVAANFKLQRNQELSFVVGQAGTNPCLDEKRTFAPGQSKVNLSRLWSVVCGKKSSAADLELVRRDAQNLFGSSGGGATAIFADNNLLTVAGAGGGFFPEQFIAVPDNSSNPAGGEIYNETFKYTTKQAFWSAGNGASFGPLSQQPVNLPPNCADCAQMAGFSSVIKERRSFFGGYCPRGRLYNITGNLGGGGASCGPGAGGGAGYIGGNAGHNLHGQGGTSAFLVKNAQFDWSKGVHAGNGRILIVKCSLKCPANSTCAFEKPVPGTESKQYCQCINGVKTYANGACTSVGVLAIMSNFVSAVSEAIDVEPSIVAFLVVVFSIILFSIPYIICYIAMRLRYETTDTAPWIKRLKFCFSTKKRRNEEFGDFEMTASVGSPKPCNGGNLIRENPIYEKLVLIELPHISRHYIQIQRSIGHGAFGEVYEGFFNLDGSFRKVAVKTLPIDSNPEVDCDFETEARLLNQFNHPNVVKFFGVSFEQQPKMIILEYMEGGDLRNFLRECRPKPTTPVDEPQFLCMPDLLHMALDVAHGCAYLENAKFIHRDIAARNCLLTTRGRDRIVKIGDFGMARDIYSAEYRKGGRAFLAVKWMPPEAFLDGIFNSKTDVWSFMPYTLKQNQEVMQLVVSGGRLEPPIGVPDEIYEEMLCCWNTEPNERPNFDQIVEFFTNCTNDARMMELPVPPFIYRLAQATPSSTPSTTRSSALSMRSSAPPNNDDVVTQATTSTAMASSMTESTTNSTVSMPCQGEGVNYNVFPAYNSRLSQPLMNFDNQLVRNGSFSSQDDSTLHDTCSVKQSPYRIDRSIFNSKLLSETEPFLEPCGTPPPIAHRTKRYSASIEPQDNNAAPTTNSNKPETPPSKEPDEQQSPLV
ncbi:Tyrosine-protein kinase receptor [Aphelenchoides bicaudatus]|nr:Tyrosine-protein kinase receptor [Aphelenchoides bicaudatus]